MASRSRIASASALAFSAALLVAWSGEARSIKSPKALAAQLMRTGEVPGLAMAIIRNGSVSQVSALGFADQRSQRRVTDNMIFEAASLSKPVVAYAVLKLVDGHRFTLDDLIANYVDGGPLAADPRWPRITIRMLLSHTSGLPNELRPGEDLTIGFEPGSRFSYSGIGYSYLQQAIEKTTGHGFEEEIEQLVFQPLDMNDSSFVWRADYEDRKAAGHTSIGSVNVMRKPETAKAPSSLHTTARDYGKFLAAVLNHRGLTEATWTAMTTPVITVQKGCLVCIGKPEGPAFESVSWGLGWGIETVGSKRFIFHWGENNGDFHTFAIGRPATKTGLVALTNSGNGLSIIPAITERVLASTHHAFDWMGYDRYDSPARVAQRQIVSSGAAKVIGKVIVNVHPVPSPSLLPASSPPCTVRLVP